MSIMLVAFFFGLLVWWDEKQRSRYDNAPSICHICDAAGEPRACHWTGKAWVHDDSGDAFQITWLDQECARLLETEPTGHTAVPTSHF